MNFYSCFDKQGKIIARCPTIQDIEVLKKMGRPIVEVKDMKNEESVVCSLTGSPSDFNSCLLYTSPSPRDSDTSRMPSSA